MQRITKCVMGLVLMAIFSSFAASNPVLGNWQTIDEKTQKPGSLIYIWEKNGIYYGKVAKIYTENGQKTTDRCVNCKGDKKNKPNLGLTIIEGMKPQSSTQWRGGTVLDPRDGKVYHAEMWLANNNKELHLRGYIGIPSFPRRRESSYIKSWIPAFAGMTMR